MKFVGTADEVGAALCPEQPVNTTRSAVRTILKVIIRLFFMIKPPLLL
jgi:hypothetical protein